MNRASSPTETGIGARLRHIRKAQGLTLEQLAKRSGLDKSFLSRLEREAAAASVASLLKVCAALGIQPGVLFEAPKTRLVRKDEAVAAHFGGVGVQDHILSRGLDGEVMVLRTEIAPGGHGGEEPYRFPANTDFITVLKGQLTVWVAEEEYRLGPGDSLTFSGRDPHTWRNPGPTPTVVIWVLCPAP
ncbi:helix-turn-helix domain-containing protein [Calidithermus roseus]|uniref:HTH-type transcriptional regulator PuuR n=1 Tax=Calidithermus roseus TaxID=1644118 RepID=A0A399EYP4_9DEIN|nr:XRE family transcriptional regulator [Calidithermus roseus]RIH88810.1 HTH-type transcriptional regulator PuuR [Calidithermus roseus]